MRPVAIAVWNIKSITMYQASYTSALWEATLPSGSHPIPINKSRCSSWISQIVIIRQCPTLESKSLRLPLISWIHSLFSIILLDLIIHEIYQLFKELSPAYVFPWLHSLLLLQNQIIINLILDFLHIISKNAVNSVQEFETMSNL
jgi:hypothetical protein